MFRYKTRANLALVAYAMAGAAAVVWVSVNHNMWAGSAACFVVGLVLLYAFPRLYDPSKRINKP